MDSSVTSVEILTVDVKDSKKYIIVSGLETGFIEFDELKSNKLISKFKIIDNWSFGGKVHRIKSIKNLEERKFSLACCGDDHSVRLFSISFDAFN